MTIYLFLDADQFIVDVHDIIDRIVTPGLLMIVVLVGRAVHFMISIPNATFAVGRNDAIVIRHARTWVLVAMRPGTEELIPLVGYVS